MEYLITAIISAVVSAGVSFAVSIKLISTKTARSDGRITDQSKINAGGDIAGGDIRK